jgi:DNA-binding transcriptional ArsR family regulator
MDAVFKALADRSRRRLLDLLYGADGQTLTALCEQLDMSRQAVSKHLGILEGAGLISCLWTGREKHHYLNPGPIEEIGTRWIDKYARRRLEALGALRVALEHQEETPS